MPVIKNSKNLIKNEFYAAINMLILQFVHKEDKKQKEFLDFFLTKTGADYLCIY